MSDEKHVCERCDIEFALKDLAFIFNAYFCPDCEDFHSGYVCKNCLPEKPEWPSENYFKIFPKERGGLNK